MHATVFSLLEGKGSKRWMHVDVENKASKVEHFAVPLVLIFCFALDSKTV
jgi:hypothetical protein